MTAMTPVEEFFAEEMRRRGIPFEPQKGLMWRPGHCASRYRCKCGESWCDESGDWHEGADYGDASDCRWYVNGSFTYRLDFFVAVGPGLAIEIDDHGTHSTEHAKRKDREREERIEKRFGFQFIRFSAREVRQNPGRCVDDLMTVIGELSRGGAA